MAHANNIPSTSYFLNDWQETLGCVEKNHGLSGLHQSTGQVQWMNPRSEPSSHQATPIES